MAKSAFRVINPQSRQPCALPHSGGGRTVDPHLCVVTRALRINQAKSA
jgi:hypothetical protein